MRPYIFYYHIKNDAELVRDSAPEHATYWKERKLLGGMFRDFTGGFIVFEATDDEEAELMIHQDAFLENGVLEDFELKEWKND